MPFFVPPIIPKGREILENSPLRFDKHPTLVDAIMETLHEFVVFCMDGGSPERCLFAIFAEEHLPGDVFHLHLVLAPITDSDECFADINTYQLDTPMRFTNGDRMDDMMLTIHLVDSDGWIKWRNDFAELEESEALNRLDWE